METARDFRSLTPQGVEFKDAEVEKPETKLAALAHENEVLVTENVEAATSCHRHGEDALCELDELASQRGTFSERPTALFRAQVAEEIALLAVEVAHASARSLEPGGIYVLGVHLTDYAHRGRMRERWVGKRGNTRVVCNIQSWPPEREQRRERVRSRLRVERNGETECFETSWWFRTYDAAQLKRLLRKVPALDLCATYDFTYDFSAQRELNDDQLDCLLILRRR